MKKLLPLLFQFFFNLGKIDLPRSIHTNFQSEIRILSAIRALFTKGLHSNPRPQYQITFLTCDMNSPLVAKSMIEPDCPSFNLNICIFINLFLPSLKEEAQSVDSQKFLFNISADLGLFLQWNIMIFNDTHEFLCSNHHIRKKADLIGIQSN